MSIEQFQEQLLECFNGTPDHFAQHAAQTANQYTEMLKAGQLSNEEYIQLLNDIRQVNTINIGIHNQQVMEYMNTAITGLINIAKIVV
jgi:hypothetical protein